MTIASTTNRNNYTGNGSVSAYDYTYRIFDEDDLLITVRDTDDVETTLVLSTDYTVSGVGDDGGGTVTLVNSNQDWLDSGGDLLTGYILSIRRVRPLLQETDIRNQGDFLPETHEDEFDRGVMVAQQQQDELDRSIKLSETFSSVDTVLPAPSAGLAIGWNATEDGLTNLASTGAISVTAFAESLLDDASASEARDTLGIPALLNFSLRSVEFKTFSDSPITLTASDLGKLYSVDCTAGVVAFTLPTIAGVSSDSAFCFKKSDSSSNAVTVTRASTDTVDGGTSKSITVQNAGFFLASESSTSPDSWTSVSFSAPVTSAGGLGSGGSVTKSADYTVVSGDDKKVIEVDTSSLLINITLPTPAAGFMVTIKDYVGNAQAKPITVLRSSVSEKIDNGTGDDTILEGYKAVTYLSDGTDWYRIASFSGSAVAGRALFSGGSGPSDVIDYVTIATSANATDFGNLSLARNDVGSASSRTRGLVAGGSTGAANDTIDYVTISTVGNATDFGNLSVTRRAVAGLSSATRAVFGGGSDESISAISNVMDYVTIASTGNATNFGNLTLDRYNLGACSSTTRGLFAGGRNLDGGGTIQNIIDYITIASTGNATDFGDTSVTRYGMAGLSSSTRGVFAGGGASNVIDYVTIASTGNATDFGDLSVARQFIAGAAGSVRGVFAGGNGPSNVMDYITIASVGNATDFGDLSVARANLAGCSDSHGGL